LKARFFSGCQVAAKVGCGKSVRIEPGIEHVNELYQSGTTKSACHILILVTDW
jgi:hypothetical protein